MNLDTSIKENIKSILCLEEFLNKEEINNFYIKMENYLKNRSIIETFYKNLSDTVEFLKKLGFNMREICLSIFNWPSIIHADKNDLLYKYLVLGLLKDHRLSDIDRDEIFISHPKDLMTGIDTIYARIKFFLSNESDDVTRKDLITRRKLLKVTNNEFAESYGVGRDQLVAKYPFTSEEVLPVLLNCNENMKVVESFYGNSQKFGK